MINVPPVMIPADCVYGMTKIPVDVPPAGPLF